MTEWSGWRNAALVLSPAHTLIIPTLSFSSPITSTHTSLIHHLYITYTSLIHHSYTTHTPLVHHSYTTHTPLIHHSHIAYFHSFIPTAIIENGYGQLLPMIGAAAPTLLPIPLTLPALHEIEVCETSNDICDLFYEMVGNPPNNCRYGFSYGLSLDALCIIQSIPLFFSPSLLLSLSPFLSLSLPHHHSALTSLGFPVFANKSYVFNTITIPMPPGAPIPALMIDLNIHPTALIVDESLRTIVPKSCPDNLVDAQHPDHELTQVLPGSGCSLPCQGMIFSYSEWTNMGSIALWISIFGFVSAVLFCIAVLLEKYYFHSLLSYYSGDTPLYTPILYTPIHTYNIHTYTHPYTPILPLPHLSHSLTHSLTHLLLFRR